MLENNKKMDQIKIIDFGTSAKFNGKDLYDKTGTPYYVAPEVLTSKYGPKCDIWSCGVIAFYMLSRQQPFEGEDKD